MSVPACQPVVGCDGLPMCVSLYLPAPAVSVKVKVREKIKMCICVFLQ